MSHDLDTIPPVMPTLLVVDDQPINVRAMHEAFAPDHRVLMATSGAEALKVCGEHLPDLVLLDVVMPGIGGHEVCRRLKADPRTAGIPIIFVTAQDEPSQEMLGLQLGAVDFIGKPVNPAVMRARVRTHLELRRTAQRLAGLNESLETRIAERTRDLEEALHAAAAGSRAKSRFLSNISHELLTPINGVVGTAYLALRADPSAQQREYLEKIHLSGRHLQTLVENVLDFSSMGAGDVALEDLEFEITDVFMGVSSRTAAAARAKGLALSFETDLALAGRLRGDPLRIGQVLIHYVDNATKFSDHGHIRVSATRLGCDATHEHVRFDVQDDGIGLRAGELDALFKPFHQVDGSLARGAGGSGLGLAVCHQVAAMMGGAVGVRSEEGMGSTFWFTVSLARALVSAPLVGRRLEAEVSRDPLRGARILVAEDNPINLQLTVALLEAVGAVVDAVEDGRQAVEQAARARYDCILMDVQMPVMDGLEATRRLRADPATRGIPVLALTANASREDRTRCMDCGMNDVIAKPILPADLYAALAHWLAPAPSSVDGTPAAGAGAAAPVDVPDDLIDLRILTRSVGGDPARFQRFARLFMDSLSGTLAELDQALADEDMGKLADLGHRLKSSSRMVGALGFAAMCERLEEMRDDDTLLRARQVVDRMPGILALVTSELAKGLQ